MDTDSKDPAEDNIGAVNLSNELVYVSKISENSMEWVFTTVNAIIYRSHYHVNLQ